MKRGEDGSRWGVRPEAGANLWTALAGLLGALLWAQLLMVPLFEELRFEDQSASASFLYLLPLACLFPAVILRWPLMALFLFPASLIPGMVMMPELAATGLQEPSALLRVGVTGVIYLALAAYGHAEADERAELETLDDEQGEPLKGVYPLYFTLRSGLFMGAFLVLSYGVLADGAVVEAMVSYHEGHEASARVFVALFIFFVWCVAAYSMWLMPVMNFEYDARQLIREFGEQRVQAKASVKRRLMIWGAVSGVSGVLALVVIGPI